MLRWTGVKRRCSFGRALSTRNAEPESASRPWDKNRDGFVMGEGAGVLCMESLDHAKVCWYDGADGWAVQSVSTLSPLHNGP